MKGRVLLGLLAALALALWLAGKEVDVQHLEDKLVGLTPHLGQWGRQLARAANNTAPLEVSPLKWGIFVGAGVMDRESQGGKTLRPRGAGGTGDFVARVGRWLERDDVADVVDELPAGWSAPRDRSGNALPPPYAIPKDRAGWGRGLMQLDLGTHPELLNAPEKYGDPDWNIGQGAHELADLYKKLPADMGPEEKLQRTADAYNAGPRALSHGDPDSLTTGGDYGSDVLARAAAAEEALA